MTEFEKDLLKKVDTINRVATYIFALILIDLIGKIVFFTGK